MKKRLSKSLRGDTGRNPQEILANMGECFQSAAKTTHNNGLETCSILADLEKRVTQLQFSWRKKQPRAIDNELCALSEGLAQLDRLNMRTYIRNATSAIQIEFDAKDLASRAK